MKLLFSALAAVVLCAPLAHADCDKCKKDKDKDQGTTLVDCDKCKKDKDKDQGTLA